MTRLMTRLGKWTVAGAVVSLATGSLFVWGQSSVSAGSEQSHLTSESEISLGLIIMVGGLMLTLILSLIVQAKNAGRKEGELAALQKSLEEHKASFHVREDWGRVKQCIEDHIATSHLSAEQIGAIDAFSKGSWIAQATCAAVHQGVKTQLDSIEQQIAEVRSLIVGGSKGGK